MNIGDSIRLNRKKANLTMRELADRVELSEQAISQYELGKRNPNLETLIKISKGLDIDYKQLIANTEHSLPELDDLEIPNLEAFWKSTLNTPEKLKERDLQNALLKIINKCGFNIYLNNNYFNDLESIYISYKDKSFSLSSEEYADLVKDIFESTTKCILYAELKK